VLSFIDHRGADQRLPASALRQESNVTTVTVRTEPAVARLRDAGRWYNGAFGHLDEEQTVRAGIHPEYHEVEARCACGATWKTRSTRKELRLEICSNCHPFFTGRQKLVDTEGRVERFTKKDGQQTVAALKARQQQARQAAAKAAAPEPRRPEPAAEASPPTDAPAAPAS